jgi:hypothetical protein
MLQEIKSPILFMVFNRPEKTQRVWDVIRKVKPQKLYISSDAPRITHTEDNDKVEQVREIIKNVDWDCDVKYLFHETNLGCTLAGKTAFDWVFSFEEEMIELEDDVLPTTSFFWFMQEMLDKYRNDSRICYICAENYGVKSGDATYYFSQYGGSWGWATWKRVYALWEYKLESLEDFVNTKKFIKSFPTKFQYKYWKRKFLHWKYVGGNTYDLQTIYLIHKYNLLNIVPNVNLVTNIGWDPDASNTFIANPKDAVTKKFSNIPSFELSEIKHPGIIEADPIKDIQWFNYNFKNKSEFEYRIRWFVSPYYRKILKIIHNAK